jgi:hypothetical protein
MFLDCASWKKWSTLLASVLLEAITRSCGFTKPGVQPAPRRGAFGLFHFAILLPDRAALGQFAEHLSRLGIRAGMADHLVSEAYTLRIRTVSASRCTRTARERPGDITIVNLP